VVELPVEGLFSPLGWLFRRFGPLYAPEVDVGFGPTEALQEPVLLAVCPNWISLLWM
jgi:hypothetical protein